jgi:hypothetical protein
VTFGATPKTGQKTSKIVDLFVSAPLKLPSSLAASIFQSVNTIRGNDLFSIQYISHYRRNVVKDVHQCFHEIFLRNILPAPPINIPNFIFRHINLHSSTVPWLYVHKSLRFYLSAIRNQVNILCDGFTIGRNSQIFNSIHKPPALPVRI